MDDRYIEIEPYEEIVDRAEVGGGGGGPGERTDRLKPIVSLRYSILVFLCYTCLLKFQFQNYICQNYRI